MHALLAALYLSIPVQAPSYRAVLLEDMGFGSTVASVNESGQVTGSIGNGHTATAAHWDATGHLTVLGRLETQDASWAVSINDSGVMVGGGLFPTTQSVPLIWTLKDGGHPISFPKPSLALDINNAGDILLDCYGTSLGFPGALLKRGGAIHGIDGVPAGISENGLVAGNYIQGGAFRWSIAGGYQALLPASGYGFAQALGIGPDGTALGSCEMSGVEIRATAWDLSGQPTLLPYAIVSTDALAFDSNSAGQIVGGQYGYRQGQDPVQARSYGTLWQSGSAYILEDLISEGPRPAITWAPALNDAGQIVCSGLLNGQPVAVRLDPL